MARRKTQTLTEVELEFMQVIWERGEVVTEDLQDALKQKGRSLSDGSVRKMLSILKTKGYVSRRRDGHGFVYWPTVPRDTTNQKLVLDLARRAFGGSAALMVASLVDSNAITRAELAKIKRLIAKREKEARDA